MSTLWVIGDSTVSSFEDKYYYPRYGYGTMLDKYLNDNVKVVNIASVSYTHLPEEWKKLGIKTRYYTTNLHRGAFMLPGYVEQMLEEEENEKKA